MFTGIIESLGSVQKIEKEGDNINFTIKSTLASDAYIDQSISHNGVCLTVVSIDTDESTYVVTAIKETLDVTNLSIWQINSLVNLERSMKPDTRLDGHFVQGHVDTITECIDIQSLDGSWYFTFKIDAEQKKLLVNKGSVAINGTSLTVIIDEQHPNQFKVAIIPYTFEHTNFKALEVGSIVNIEFDILGKYIARHISNYTKAFNN